MEVTIYHNPRCSKSRQALSLIQSKGIEPNINLYLDNGLGRSEVIYLLQLLKLGIRDIIRSKEEEYKNNSLHDISLNENQLLDVLIKYPKLLERPIVVVNNTMAEVCRPPEKVLNML